MIRTTCMFIAATANRFNELQQFRRKLWNEQAIRTTCRFIAHNSHEKETGKFPTGEQQKPFTV